MTNNSTHLVLLLLVFVSSVALIAPVIATDHIVGANKGWNPGINYTLCANNHTIYVGDYISFRYQKNQYNVFMVNETGYDNCTLDSAVGNWTSGKDFILFNDSGRYYFICGNGQCMNGMKVTVLVHPLLTPTASPSTKNSSSDSAVLVAPRLGFRVLVTSLAVMWFGGACGSSSCGVLCKLC